MSLLVSGAAACADRSLLGLLKRYRLGLSEREDLGQAAWPLDRLVRDQVRVDVECHAGALVPEDPLDCLDGVSVGEHERRRLVAHIVGALNRRDTGRGSKATHFFEQ